MKVKPKVDLPVYNGGTYLGRRKFQEVPVASSFKFIAPDTFIGHYICDRCGPYNSYQCSCRRLARERSENGGFTLRELEELCECGAEKEPGEELCPTCHDNL